MQRLACGLMTTDLPKRNSRHVVLGDTWQLLAVEGHAANLPLVFFHPHDINVARRTTNGYTFDPHLGWRYGCHPLPQVIVDNVMLYVARHNATYAAAKRALHRMGVIFLNPRLPDKWGVWQALRNWKPLAPHLPETTLLQHVRDIDLWLQAYETVFLKPVRGSGGHGVIEIRQMDEQEFLVTEQSRFQVSRTELHEMVEHLLASEKEKLLLQRGLPLLEVEASKIDVRVVLHRDGQRQWQPIATVPRLGMQGQAVTNLAQGGQVRSLAWLADMSVEHEFVLPEQEAIERVAIAGAEAVTEIRPTLAFLGIDIALDQEGGIWLLDINPRPGRKVLTSDDRQRAFQHLIAYMKTLI